MISTPSVMRRSEVNAGFGRETTDELLIPRNLPANTTIAATIAKRPTVWNDFQITSVSNTSHTPSMHTNVKTATARTNKKAALSCIAFMSKMIALAGVHIRLIPKTKTAP